MTENLPPSGRAVVILGASSRPDRYAHMAQKRLMAAGFPVIPIHPTETTIEGVPVVPDLSRVEGTIDTVTLYVGPRNQEGLAPAIAKLKPGRVVFNPGTENDRLEMELKTLGIPTTRSCTLVMLSVGNF